MAVDEDHDVFAFDHLSGVGDGEGEENNSVVEHPELESLDNVKLIKFNTRSPKNSVLGSWA